MIKKLLNWAAMFLIVAGVSAGSAYLAFEASPDPIFVSDTIEKPVEVIVTKTVEVEVEHKYDGHMYIAIFEGPALPDGTRQFIGREVMTDKLPGGALYLLKLDFDVDLKIPFIYLELGLWMPDMDVIQTLPILIENATNVRITYIAGWDIPELGENEDEF